MKSQEAETLLIIQNNWIGDIGDKIDAVSRLLSTALEQNNPVIDVCWYMTQSIADEIASETSEILNRLQQPESKAEITE